MFGLTLKPANQRALDIYKTDCGCAHLCLAAELFNKQLQALMDDPSFVLATMAPFDTDAN